MKFLGLLIALLCCTSCIVKGLNCNYQGNDCLENNDIEGAIACYEKSYEINPHSSMTVFNLTGLYIRNGDVRKAWDFAHQGAFKNPKDEFATNNCSLVFLNYIKREIVSKEYTEEELILLLGEPDQKINKGNQFLIYGNVSFEFKNNKLQSWKLS